MADRIPPQNLEFEMALLGAILVDSELAVVARAAVRAGDFYAHVHETIFAAIESLHDANAPIDKLAVAEELQRRKQLEHVGSLPYLSRLMDVTPSAETTAYYAAVIAEKATLRRLIAAANQIGSLAYDGESDVEAAISDAERALRRAIGTDAAGKGMTLADAARDAFTELSEVASGQRPSGALLTPWRGVNELVGGFFPGELVVIAAAPAQGKTGLVISLADYFSQRYGDVAFFSLEMQQRAIAQRWLALYSEVSARTQRIGVLRDRDWDALGNGLSLVSRSRVHLFGRQDAPGIAQIERAISTLARRGPVCAIVLDHVNFLADADVGKRDNATKHERLDRAYRKLLSIASDYGTVVFAVQHLNRQGMGVAPKLSQIRDGGNPEGHAHAVIMPYRPDPGSANPVERMRGELHIAKSRDGEEGHVEMEFHGWRHAWTEPGKPLWFERDGAA